MNKKLNFKVLAIFLLIATFFVGCSSLNKMVKHKDQIKYEVTPKVIETNGGIIEFSIKGIIPENYFNKKAAILFTPALTYNDNYVLLSPITLQGENVVGDGIVINSKTGGTFMYKESIEYTPEMIVSELVVDPIAYIVKNKVKIDSKKEEIKQKSKFAEFGETKMADGVIYTSERIMNNETIIIAKDDYEKETLITESATMFFAVNRHNLNWNLDLNKDNNTKQVFGDLDDFLKKGWKIKDITIDAFASPEGEERFNEGLSKKRGNTVLNLFEKRVKKLSKEKDSKVCAKHIKNDVPLKINALGEDWNGFLKSVASSNLKEKHTIINVIKSSDQLKKEQEIRNMINIYPEIEDKILPPLRRAEIIVTCYEPKLTDEEISRLSTTYPDSLKVNELLYSATLTDKLQTKLRIFKSAISIYPKCWRAYNNAAAIDIQLGNLDEADGYLNKAKTLKSNNGMIENNLGVVASKNGEYALAESHYNAAKKLGEYENYNLGILSITKGDYDKALSLFSKEKCDYNLALAQLLAGETEKAEKTLKCAPKCGETYYLMAIAGARTQNTEIMYKYLSKAVEAKPDLKKRAKTDREFLEFENVNEFKKIVE
jgi:tetratricopeptide (TPR) repeat protein